MVNWKQSAAAVALAATVLTTGTAAPAKADPQDWTVTTSWDLRPWGGHDYGLVLQGPSSDIKKMLEAADPYTLIGNSAAAAGAKAFPAEALAASIFVNVTTARFKWCTLTERTKMKVAAIAVFVEDPGFTWWDRVLGRETYHEEHQWFLYGCDQVK